MEDDAGAEWREAMTNSGDSNFETWERKVDFHGASGEEADWCWVAVDMVRRRRESRWMDLEAMFDSDR